MPGKSNGERVEAMVREVARLQRPHAVSLAAPCNERDGRLRGEDRARAGVTRRPRGRRRGSASRAA
jgi:hypothetical protein